MTIIPRGHMVLVKPDPEASRVSEHGIVTPSAVEQERKAVGTVVEVSNAIRIAGNQKCLMASQEECENANHFGGVPKVGDKVIFSVYSGETVMDGKEEYKLLYVSDDKDNEVLAFIR